jgi:hypothetical protein
LEIHKLFFSMFSSLKHRNNKQKYYFLNYLSLLIPDFIFRCRLKIKLNSLKKFDLEYIKRRVNYYNKLSKKNNLIKVEKSLESFKIKNYHRTYFFDTYEYTRFFEKKLKLKMLFGDITHSPDLPSIVKSRPINDKNHNSILMKLNKVRHFTYTNDSNKFDDKINKLIGRSAITKNIKKELIFLIYILIILYVISVQSTKTLHIQNG